MTTIPSRVVLGPGADELLAAASDDDSAWLPLSDMLEESGQATLARLALAASAGGMLPQAFFRKVVSWLASVHFDPGTMEVIRQVPPFSVDRRWVVWKSILYKDGWYNRVAVVMKGGAA